MNSPQALAMVDQYAASARDHLDNYPTIDFEDVNQRVLAQAILLWFAANYLANQNLGANAAQSWALSIEGMSAVFDRG